MNSALRLRRHVVEPAIMSLRVLYQTRLLRTTCQQLQRPSRNLHLNILTSTTCTFKRYKHWQASPQDNILDNEEPSDGQEEATKAAILDKVMKVRSPTELLLRCALLGIYSLAAFTYSIYLGTILDAAG